MSNRCCHRGKRALSALPPRCPPPPNPVNSSSPPYLRALLSPRRSAAGRLIAHALRRSHRPIDSAAAPIHLRWLSTASNVPRDCFIYRVSNDSQHSVAETMVSVRDALNSTPLPTMTLHDFQASFMNGGHFVCHVHVYIRRKKVLLSRKHGSGGCKCKEGRISNVGGLVMQFLYGRHYVYRIYTCISVKKHFLLSRKH